MTNPSRLLLSVGVLLMASGIPRLAAAQTVVQCAASATVDFENCATSQFFTQAMQGSLGFGQVTATYVLPSTSVAETAYVQVSAQVYQSGGGPGPPAYVYSPSLTMTPVGSNGVSLAAQTEAQQEQTWRDYDVTIYGVNRMTPLTVDGSTLSGFPTGFSTDPDSQLQSYLVTSQPGIWNTLMARQALTSNYVYIFVVKFPNGDTATYLTNNGIVTWDFPVAHDVNGNMLSRAGYAYPSGCPASQNCPHPGYNGQPISPPSGPPFPPCAYIGPITVTTGNGVQKTITCP
jgi:hypothetical protein